MKTVLIFCTIVSMLLACRGPLKQALDLAGENRSELEKVLEYYKYQGNEEKYAASCFLIQNMIGNASCDTSHLVLYRSFLSWADSLNSVHKDNSKLLKEKLKSSWQLYKDSLQLGSQYQQYFADCETIDADYLIREIELAYMSWNNNPYKSSFADFMEYILPYRRINGLPIEDWREHFYLKYKNHFHDCYPLPLLKACDTLLYEFREIKHSRYILTDYPLLKVEDFEQLKIGLCYHKCWYNSMAFSSLGIPCAIDFVPAWGNKNRGHSWNVIIDNGESHAFEPFWDNDRWKYKRIYNNKSWDNRYGVFKLPKVYRHTFASHPEGPILDTRIQHENIPSLFRNIKKKDVSHEYFEVQDVEIELSNKVPDNTYYCYLCVFGYHQWHPVQWGKIEGDKVKFKAMGKGIVYLPCFYQNGSFKYAADPFLLTEKGVIESLVSTDEIKQDISINRLIYQNPNYGEGIKGLKNCRIEVSDDACFSSADIVCHLPDSMLYRLNINYLKEPVKGRYVRIIFSDPMTDIAELQFYAKKVGGQLERLVGQVIFSEGLNTNNISNVFDGLTATSWSNEQVDLIDNCDQQMAWIGLDLGKNTEIDGIGYCPKIDSQLSGQNEYELLVWNDGWKPIARKKGNGGVLNYTDVPANSLLLLKNKQWSNRSRERIFIYKNGEQKWY